MSQDCPPEYIELAGRLADAARSIILGHYRSGFAVERKSDRSPVTAADRETEEAIRRLIAQECPRHGVLGEEFGYHDPAADYVWVIDPIDGTEAFICGVPVFCTLIALLHEGWPLLGLIDQPVTRERWLGARGLPTTLNGRPVRVRPCPDPAGAVLCATTPRMFSDEETRAFTRVADRVGTLRYGADGYAYGLLATGTVDLVIEADLDPYDYMAHVPVIEGAGGLITDWEGRSLDLTTGATRVAAAGDRALHARALSLLAGDAAGQAAPRSPRRRP